MGDKKEPAEKKSTEEKKDAKGSKDPTQDKIAELTDDLKRVQAEFENYKKRCEKENTSFREYAKADLIKRLITVLDSFEIALRNTGNHKEFVKGVELIYSQLYSVLKDEGLQPIDCLGKTFDPYCHEVMLTQPSEKEDDTIIEELQKGYRLKGQVIRHSKVRVSKND